jgi:ribosomal protection tetracycline resistance protein
MFPPPALETAVVARDPRQQIALHAALTELADVDPLIRLRPDDHQGAVRITVYGEVQQQVIAETLAAEHGIEVDFRATTVICVERPAGIGEAALRMGEPGHLYGATLGVTVEPTAPGAGVELVLTAPRTTLPLHIYSTVEGFREALRRYLDKPLAAGPYGWQVTDIRVTVTESGYIPPGPAPADVRHTTALMVAAAVRRAGTVACEPVDRFRVEAPTETVSTVLSLIGRHRGIPDAPQTNETVAVITGTIPTAAVDKVRRGLHAATHGEGLLESSFDHHTPIRGTPPRRGT